MQSLALEAKTKLINGRTYTICPLPAFRACDAFETLTKMAGPSLAALQTAGLNSGIEIAVAALCKNLGGGQIRQLVTILLADARVTLDGRESAMLDGFDLRYAGKLFEVFQVVAFAVEVNFGDFFEGLRNLLGSPQPVAKSQSTSPSA